MAESVHRIYYLWSVDRKIISRINSTIIFDSLTRPYPYANTVTLTSDSVRREQSFVFFTDSPEPVIQDGNGEALGRVDDSSDAATQPVERKDKLIDLEVVREECMYSDCDVSDESALIETPDHKRKQDLSFELCTPQRRRACGESLNSCAAFVGMSSQMIDLINQVNSSSSCNTPGCKGILRPKCRLSGLGGALEMTFSCSGCAQRELNFKSSTDHETNQPVLGLMLQIAYVTAGCSYSRYHRSLELAMGMHIVSEHQFYQTLEFIAPVVKQLLDDVCEENRNDMKALDKNEMGSWQRACTEGDGTWLTRKFSQNATFTIRNHLTRTLLYYEHACQRGRNEDTLFMGTSKAAEGFLAERCFSKAKEDGMVIEVHWSDSDSSSDKAIRSVYPNVEIFRCTGHLARNHEARMNNWKGQKSFTQDQVKKYSEKYPSVKTVTCHCKKNHNYKNKCGCLTPEFVSKSKANFNQCLHNVGESRELFQSRMQSLGKYHGKNKHTWEGGQCDFHPLKLCTCGDCNKENILCQGKEYSSYALTCPFHSLAYEIECANIASLANQIVHPELGIGNTHQLESSHSVLTKYRSKDQYLHDMHYCLSTNLALLQTTMPYMWKKKGLKYHWLIELFKKLNLPLLDGMEEALYIKNKHDLWKSDYRKERSVMTKRRIAKRRHRGIEQEIRKRFTKRQPIVHDYGFDLDLDCGFEDIEYGNRASTPTRKKGKTCMCGSTTHSRTSHRSCPLNKVDFEQDDMLDLPSCSDQAGESPYNLSSDTCHSNSDLNPEPSKLQSLSGDLFNVGDYICVHSSKLVCQHVLCRVVQDFKGYCKLCCKDCVLKGVFPTEELKHVVTHDQISLSNWRCLPLVPLCDIEKCTSCLEHCSCSIDEYTSNVIDISDDEDENPGIDDDSRWVENGLQSLTCKDRQTILAPTGWLHDGIISFSQRLLFQQYGVAGLQSPLLQKTLSFIVHQKELFVQVINVDDNHWCVVSNFNCGDNELRVYDSLYSSFSYSTERIIASLVFCCAQELRVHIMNVTRQKNAHDCGVLALVYASDLCNGHDPCSVSFESNNIRQHLTKCLEERKFSRFPIARSKREGITSVRRTVTISIHCSCRMTNNDDCDELAISVMNEDVMAQCEICSQWFHKNCLEIPSNVFKEKGVSWVCRLCKNT